jgi:alpha-L-fucosidase 2
VIDLQIDTLQKKHVIPWDIHSEYCHHGIPLSNGIFGALVWFQDNRIMVTINRTDYWDHRGGTEWTEDIKYETLKKYLQAGDFETAKNMFRPMYINGEEKRPTRLPMGRFELCLKEGAKIYSAELNLSEAEASIIVKSGETFQTVQVSILMDTPILAVVGGSEVIDKVNIRPAFEFSKVLDYFKQFDIMPGETVEEGSSKGWIQELPSDPACAVWSEWNLGRLYITSVYGDTREKALQHAKDTISLFKSEPFHKVLLSSKQIWKALWEKAANITIPADNGIERIYYMGIYKLLGNSMPGKTAPSLQGPWAEEYRIPPWSCDYHFNINVQECLWPAYGANLLECLDPLFTMIDSWKPRLALNAEYFVGIEDGYMLNHSTDDRGTPTGGMWTGTIDHANTSWVGQMMWQKYIYSMDEEYLLHEVYPFLKRAMNVYIELMDKEEEHYVLPITVSPEYGGSGQNALGRNSSFFLANVHFLCEKLIEIAEKYEIDFDYAAKLKEIRDHLPLYTTGIWQPLEWPRKNDVSDQEIYLWEGQPLEVSHRHHSHLAGIYPFDVIDLEEDIHRAIVGNSIKTWVDKGMGRWAGWSMPWASILLNRVGNSDSAFLMLKLYESVYMNKGYASQHNGSFPGFTQFVGGETMQVEASIAMSAAILEMYVQCSRGQIKVFSGMPEQIKDTTFSNIRAEGAFLISGEMINGDIAWVKVFSEQGSCLHLVNPYSGPAYIYRDGGIYPLLDKNIKILTKPGETIWVSKTTDISSQI